MKEITVKLFLPSILWFAMQNSMIPEIGNAANDGKGVTDAVVAVEELLDAKNAVVFENFLVVSSSLLVEAFLELEPLFEQIGMFG